MKTVFFKEVLPLIFMLIIILLFWFVIFAIAFPRVSINNVNQLHLIIAAIAIPLICIVVLLIFPKNFLSKIVVSKEGIEWRLYKKRISFITWDEVTDVREKTVGRGNTHIVFYRGSDKIQMEISRKLYNAIMELCENQGVKSRLRNLNRNKIYQKTPAS